MPVTWRSTTRHGGGGGSAYEMGCFIDRLREKYRVIIPSTRGHGRSGFGTEPLALEQKARDMLAVLKTENVTRTKILGFSDGAYTALKMAVMAPEIPERIVAIGAGENIPGLRRVVTDLNEFRSLDAAYIAQQEHLMPEPARRSEWLRAYGDFWTQEKISKNVFMQIKAPVLLMAGELDGNAPLDTVLAAYREVPDAGLAIIPGAGHPCFLTHFDAVWSSMRRFIGM